MSNPRIPKDKKWRGIYPGNYTGSLWQTRNIDLGRSPGRATLADKMRIHADTTDSNMSNLGVVTKFIRTNADVTDRFWALCSSGTTGGKLFKTATASPIDTWAEETASGVPTDCLDMEIHESANGEQRLLVTRATDVAILNKTGGANAWDNDWGTTVASPAISLASGTRHPIARLQRLIAIGNGNTINTIDKNDVVVNARITLPYGYDCRWIIASSDRFWFGCTNSVGGSSKIIEWDGTSLSYNNEYDIIGTTPLCGFLINNIPYAITEFGYIFRYFGGSFQQLDSQFPLAEEILPLLNISPYGTAVDRSSVYILANNTEGADLTSSRRFRAGIWMFDSRTGDLYHQRGIPNHKTAGTDPDFGQSPLSDVGALLFTVASNTTLLMAGAKVYTNFSNATLNAIFRNIRNRVRYASTGYNRGSFITTYLPIADVSAMWEGVVAKFKRFVDSNNRIVIKGRVVDPKVLTTADTVAAGLEMTVEATGTWASTTTFTSVVPTGVIVGDEVEVMSGNGAGCTFHISTLSATPDNSATITVTVDEALPTLNAGGSRGALFRFENWVKMGTLSSTSVGHDKVLMPSQQHGEFLQLKVELRGYEMEIDELIPFSKSDARVDQL